MGQTIKSFIPVDSGTKGSERSSPPGRIKPFRQIRDGHDASVDFDTKIQLPADEAIQFLGGNETDRYRHVLILFLQKIKPRFMTRWWVTSAATATREQAGH